MFEDIFEVNRGRSFLDSFLSPADDKGLLRDIERWKTFLESFCFFVFKFNSIF